MRLNPLLDDPFTVLLSRAPVGNSPAATDFARGARQVMEALGVELDGERVVIKPNVTAGQMRGGPDTGITTHAGFVGGLVDYLCEHGARPRRGPWGR